MDSADQSSSVHRFLAWFLKRFFQLLYHQMAWGYDLVAALVSLGLWKEWVGSILPFVETGPMLELGHGPGHLQVACVKKIKQQVFGIDASRWMSRQAQRNLLRHGYKPCLANARAQHLPFPSLSFATIVATFPNEYITDPDTLAEIYRLLAPGGKAVVLPLAWITRKRLPESALAWLFRVTGQAPAWDDRFLEPLLGAGFEVKTHHCDLASSKILVIQATKPLLF